ncbi:transposase, partial [Lactobacillus crispatus]|nr:transposase [Lactobacillus crispatus]
DHEQPCWENGNKSRKRQGKSPVNRRIKRGLFKANDDRLINADVNGALQIIRKVFSNFQVNDEIAGVVLRPVKWSPKF